MITNTPQRTKQQESSILRAKQIIAMLGCFYFCTALVTCFRHPNHTPIIKQDSLPDKPPCDTITQHVSKDYHNLDKCLCEVSKALKGDTDAVNKLEEAGKHIDTQVLSKPGFVQVAIVSNNKGNNALVLEYTRQGKLSYTKQPENESITLMVNALADPTTLPPSYKDATTLPCYIKQIQTEGYSTLIKLFKQLVGYGVDLCQQNRWGETPLTEVIQYGDDRNRVELIEILLKAGASPNEVNRKQQVPLGMINQIKKAEDREKIVKLLIDHGANPLLAQMDQATQAYVREMVIGQLEKMNLAVRSPTFHKTLTQLDTKLSLFFNQKYPRSNAVLAEKEDQTCVFCAKKQTEATTIRLPSCGHYVHGSCLAQSLIDMKSKGRIKWMPRPSYLYIHLCPCCKQDIARAFIKDLNQFYEGIKFEHRTLTLALRIAFAIPCATVIPGGLLILAGLFWPTE